MKDLKLTIQINKPVSEVFAFTIDPENTSLWVESIIKEETNEWPPKLETIYKNVNIEGIWQEYKVTEFEMNKIFVFSSTDSSYNVKYTFTPIDENSCELEYYEWVKDGLLDAPFTIESLQKLKNILEK